MIQKIYKSTTFFVFMTPFMYGHSFDSTLQMAQKQYAKALQDFLAVYAGMNPPFPIQFNQSDLVGATYSKIIRPYVIQLHGYSNVVMSEYARQYSYRADLKILHKKFEEYNKHVMSLTELFPKERHGEALFYFYNQLTDSLVQNCVKIVQGISYALDIKKESLDNALIAYDLAWKAQTPTMKLTGFSDVTVFRRNMTSWMVSLYQAALSQATSDLQTTTDRVKIYKQMAEYYKVLQTVYANSGDTQKAQFEGENAAKMSAQIIAYKQAAAFVKQGLEGADKGQSLIIIDYASPADTKHNLTVSLEALVAAETAYTSALKIYTTQQDSAGVNKCQDKLNQLQADQQVRGIQLLWILFLQNSYRKDVVITNPAFTELQAFYKVDPKKQTFSVGAVVQALSDVLNLCAHAPNNFNENLAILPLLQGVIEGSQGAMANNPNAKNSDPLLDVKTLQDAQLAVTNFVQILQGMIVFGQGNMSVSGSNFIAQMIVQAKSIDTLFNQNSALKNLFFYFPDLEVDMGSKSSFVSFVIQYIYRIALGKVQVYMKQAAGAKEASVQDQGMIQGLSDLIMLQSYKDYITPDQLQVLQQSMISLATKMNIVQYAESMYQQALADNHWDNTINQGIGYESKADSLWNKAIELCEIGMYLSMLPHINTGTAYSTATLQKVYIQIATDYVTAFVTKAPVNTVGSQLHVLVLLYKLSILATHLQDEKTQSFVQEKLETLFGGTNGFFDLVQKYSTAANSATEGSQDKKTDDALITQIITGIHVVLEQQALAISDMTNLLQLSALPDPLLESVLDNVTVTVTMKVGSNTYTVALTNPIAVKIHSLNVQIAEAKRLAEGAEEEQDFATAMTKYAAVKQLNVALLPLLQDSAQIQACKDDYFEANTRFTAASLVNRVVMTGLQNWGTLKNIPQTYAVTQFYLNNINMQSLGGSIPKSLQKLTQPTPISDTSSKADAVAVFKAYLVSQLLADGGLAFSNCYSGYTLQKKSGLSSEDMATMAGVEARVGAYMQACKDITITASVNGSVINFIFGQLPVPPVNPLWGSGPYAAVYFVGASTLFAPGKQLVMVGGNSYVPGQDQEAYQQMFADIAYAYVSQAQQYITEAQSVGQTLVAAVTKMQKGNKSMSDSDFMSEYNKIKKGFIRAQALLFIPGQDTSCAYYYFNQAGQANNTGIVKGLFLASYSTQIALLKQLLIGNPISNSYNTVLSDLNQAYISWSVELDPVNDAAQIAQNYEAVVDLFRVAGDECMSYAYYQDMFPSVKQYHYMKAAANYQAALKQYKLMTNANQQDVDTMNNKSLQAYFYGSGQKVAVYYVAQNKGLVYTPTRMVGYDKKNSTKPKKISVAKLLQDYQSFQSGGNINQGKVNAYNDLKNLLLDAAMYFQYLGSVYGKEIPASAQPAQGAKGKTQQPSMNADLVSYLQSKNIIASGSNSISYIDKTILPKLFAIANEVFLNFQQSNNVAALADWCNALNMAIAYQYIDDYEGGISAGSDESADFQKKWQSFFQAIQKESSALQNPSSAYIG